MPVVTVAAGGLPVVDVSGSLRGTPVTEVASGRGVPVTKVATYGLPVVYETIGVVAPVVWATFDGTATNVTLSNGNRTATHSNTSTNSGARPTSSKTAGKFYFEITYNTAPSVGDPVGILQTSATYTNLVTNGSNCCSVFGSGEVYSLNTSQSIQFPGGFTAGNVLSVAVDFGAGKLWFRKNGGIWNNNGSADPATNVSGTPFAAPGGGYTPAVGFTTGGSGNNVTANFGASAFAYAVPAGFTAGWPA
jgi:hypothetical protein